MADRLTLRGDRLLETPEQPRSPTYTYNLDAGVNPDRPRFQLDVIRNIRGCVYLPYR